MAIIVLAVFGHNSLCETSEMLAGLENDTVGSL